MMAIMLKGISIIFIGAGVFSQVDQYLYDGRHMGVVAELGRSIARSFGF
jgi:hypothetical protein